MNVLLLHNSYSSKGGEDSVYSNEKTLLTNACHIESVNNISLDNEIISNFLKKIDIVFKLKYSQAAYQLVENEIANSNCSIVHAHNFFPLLSPSVFDACRDTSMPVVHTLHNFRLLCPTATLMHDGKICERSLHGSCWWTVLKRVYRNSFIGTAALAHMVEYHKHKGTWKTNVDRYIALTEFAKNKFIEGGFPADKILVKPNFIEDPYGGIKKVAKEGGYALFVGRLSEEKGLDILLDAWELIKHPLKIIGSGPLESLVKNKCKKKLNIEYLGFQDRETILPLMQHADFIVMASTCYEGFPMVLLEAFASGTPALVSNIGSMAEIVTEGKIGLHFEVGNSESLAEKAECLIQSSKITREMGQNARLEYLEKYTPEINLEMLLDIYRQTVREKKGSCPF